MVTRSRLAIVFAAAAGFLWSPASVAQNCAPVSQPFQMPLGTTINGCDDSRPLTAMAYAIRRTSSTSPLAISTTCTGIASDILCTNANDQSQGGACDAVTDPVNAVSINGNWANQGTCGCPGPDGRNVYVLRDIKGNGTIISVGFDSGSGGFVIDYAGPDTFAGIACGDRCTNDPTRICSSSVDCATPLPGDTETCEPVTPRPRVVRQSTVTGATKLDLAPPTPPKVYSDCDDGSLGGLFTSFATCPERATGGLSLAAGRFYSRLGACDGSDLTLDRRTWTLLTTTTNPDQTVSVTIPKATQGCTFLGTTFMVGPEESWVIGGSIAIAGEGIAAPAILNLKATRKGGTVTVEWDVHSEAGVLGYKVLTSKQGGDVELSRTLIDLKGDGSHYSETFRMADFAGGKDVKVRVFMADRTTSDSERVRL